jgi:hypothetical protein
VVTLSLFFIPSSTNCKKVLLLGTVLCNLARQYIKINTVLLKSRVFRAVLLVVEVFRNIDFQMRYDQFTAQLFIYFSGMT